MHFLDPEVEPGCVGKVRRLSTELSGPNFDLGPHFSALILSLSTFSFSMHYFAFSDTEICIRLAQQRLLRASDNCIAESIFDFQAGGNSAFSSAIEFKPGGG